MADTSTKVRYTCLTNGVQTICVHASVVLVMQFTFSFSFSQDVDFTFIFTFKMSIYF